MASFYDCNVFAVEEACGLAAAEELLAAIAQFGCDVEHPGRVVQFQRIRLLS